MLLLKIKMRKVKAKTRRRIRRDHYSQVVRVRSDRWVSVFGIELDWSTTTQQRIIGGRYITPRRCSHSYATGGNVGNRRKGDTTSKQSSKEDKEEAWYDKGGYTAALGVTCHWERDEDFSGTKEGLSGGSELRETEDGEDESPFDKVSCRAWFWVLRVLAEVDPAALMTTDDQGDTFVYNLIFGDKR